METPTLQTLPVRKWTTRNDANYSNRHAEVDGIQFFAFPHQNYYARKGRVSGSVAPLYRNGQFIAGVSAKPSMTESQSRWPNGPSGPKMRRCAGPRFPSMPCKRHALIGSNR